MVPQQKTDDFAYRAEIDTPDSDECVAIEEDQLSESHPRRHFTTSSKADLLNLVYNDEESSKSHKDDSDDDWEKINSGNDSRPLLGDKSIAFDRKNDKVYLKKLKDPEEYDLNTVIVRENAESLLTIMIQVFIPFLIAGFGTVGAGLVLDVVQHWEVFRNITEVFILVPALLGLKGNLEMTLASRLSTQANLGNLNTFREQWRMTVGNIALTQCQAIVVGFLAALVAVTMDWLPEGEFNLNHALLLCASSLLTASVASFLLGLLMIFVVIFSHKCSINPDNIATPIAASLGDLTTLTLLAHISNNLYHTIGVGGNLVAVQSSRISTYLHRKSKLGTLPKEDSVLCLSPCSAFCAKNIHARTASLLLMMVIPGHLIFSYGIKLLQAGHTSITFTFLVVYLFAALIQVFFLLYFAHIMIFWMWSRKIDPDNSAIPYLTAIGDLLGTGLLALAFLFLFSIGDKDADVGD